MKKKYILNGKTYDEDVMQSYAQKNNMSLPDFLKESGAVEHPDNNVDPKATYILNNKEYDANTISAYAQKNNMSVDDYVKEAGIKKKNGGTSSSPTPSQSQNIGSKIGERADPNGIDVKKEAQDFEAGRGYGLPIVGNAIKTKQPQENNLGNGFGLTPITDLSEKNKTDNLNNNEGQQKLHILNTQKEIEDNQATTQKMMPIIGSILNPKEDYTSKAHIKDKPIIEKPSWDVSDFIKNDISTAHASGQNWVDNSGIDPANIVADRNRLAYYGKQRGKDIDNEIGFLQNQYEGAGRSFNKEKIDELNNYKQKLNQSIDYFAQIHAGVNGTDATDAGIIRGKINGDPTAFQADRFKKKGIPVDDATSFSLEKQGLGAQRTAIEAAYKNKAKDAEYDREMDNVNQQDKTIFDRHPEYLKQQWAGVIGNYLSKDLSPLQKISGLWVRNIHSVISDMRKEGYDIPKSVEDNIRWNDIPDNFDISGKALEGAYNHFSDLATGIERIAGTAAGMDKDVLDYQIGQGEATKNMFATPSSDELHQSPTITDTNKDSPNYMLPVPNPNAGKLNPSGVAITDEIVKNLGGFGAFLFSMGGTAKVAENLVGKALPEIAGTADATKLAHDYSLAANVILGGYEGNYQKAQQIIGDHPEDEGKRSLLALANSFTDYLVFKIIPTQKYATALLEGKNAVTEQLGGLIKNMPADLNQQALEGVLKKNLLKPLANALEETGKFGGAQQAGIIIHKIAQSVIGNNKESEKDWNSLGKESKDMWSSLPVSMLPGILGGEMLSANPASNLRKEGNFQAFANRGQSVSDINKAVDEGIITQDDANKRIQVINTGANLLRQMPEISPKTGKPFTHNEAVTWVNNRIKEVALDVQKSKSPDDKILSDAYDEKINQLQKERSSILTGEYTPAVAMKRQPLARIDIGNDKIETTPEQEHTFNESEIPSELKDVTPISKQEVKTNKGSTYNEVKFSGQQLIDAGLAKDKSIKENTTIDENTPEYKKNIRDDYFAKGDFFTPDEKTKFETLSPEEQDKMIDDKRATLDNISSQSNINQDGKDKKAQTLPEGGQKNVETETGAVEDNAAPISENKVGDAGVIKDENGDVLGKGKSTITQVSPDGKMVKIDNVSGWHNIENFEPENKTTVDDDKLNQLKEKHGEQPTEDLSTKERKKIVLRHLLDNEDDTDGAFYKAGYKLIDGFWVDPKSEKLFGKLSDETKAILRKHNIKYIDNTEQNVGGGGSSIGGTGEHIRGLSLHNERTGNSLDHIALHEAGHAVWDDLSQETKDLFKDGNPLTEHGKMVKNPTTKLYKDAYGEHSPFVGEEDFADLFALNKGDLEKTISDKKAQSDKENNSTEDNSKTTKPAVILPQDAAKDFGQTTRESDNENPPPEKGDKENTASDNEGGVSISKGGLKEDIGFSKDFDKRGGGEVADGVLETLKNNAKSNGISLNRQISDEVENMKLKGADIEPTEHNIITAGSHLLNLDKSIKEAIAKNEDVENLIKERDATAAVLRQLGNKAGRNLGLFNLVFKDVTDSEISVARNTLSKILGTDIPETLEELKNSSLTSADKKKVEPYVRQIEELKKAQAEAENQSVKNITSLNDEEVQKAIKDAHEAGKKEGMAQGKDKPAREKKSAQLKDLASRLRTSDEMDKFLKGSSNIQKAGGFDLGSYKEIIANILYGVADVVGGAEKVGEYIKNAIDKLKDIDKDKLLSDVQMLMSRTNLPDKEKTVSDISKIATNESATTITKSMVDKGLIKNVVDDVIHSDVPYDKVIETATDELKKTLPDVTEEDVRDAYVKRNQFQEVTKGKLENIIKEKTQGVKRMANRDLRLEALEDADEYHNSETKEKKKQVISDREEKVVKRIAELTKQKSDLNKAESKTNSQRLSDAKQSVQDRIDAIREEIADKERKLTEEELPLHEDVELGRMKEVEKALTNLRDKYLPEEPEKFAEEKELKKRRVNLNNEISDLNDQINSGTRHPQTGVFVEDTDHIKTLRKIKEEKQKLLDKVAPDYEKIKKQDEERAAKHAAKLSDIDDEIKYVKNNKQVFERAIRNPKIASDDLKAARAERDKTYSENGLRVQKNDRQPIKVEREYQKAISDIDDNDNLSDKEKEDKKAEIKQQRDLDLQGTKQGVISHLSDDIENFKKDNIEKANNSDDETTKKINNLNKKLDGIRKGLKPTGEKLEDVANKAYEKINTLLEDKTIPDDARERLEEIKKDFEDNTQLTSDQLAAKILKKQWERDIKNSQTQLNSGVFTELPTTPYDFKRSVELTNLNKKREQTGKGLNKLILHAKEQNKTKLDKALDFSTKMLVSGVSTVARVGEAAIFKPVMDSLVEGTTGRLVSKFLTDTPQTTAKEIIKGFKTLAAFKNKESADRFIKKLQDNKLSAIENLKNAIDGGNREAISKAQDEFKKADLKYGISTIYKSIDANSLVTFWEYLSHGATDLDVKMGKGLKRDIKDYRTKLEKAGYVLDGWIRTHAALKTGISARNEVVRSFASTLKYFQDKNMPLDEEHLALAQTIAESDFEAGRLANPTYFSKQVSKIKYNENQAVRAAGRIIFPVSTIAINIAKRGLDYSSLGAEGWYRLAKGIKKGIRANEVEGKTYDTWAQKMADGIKSIPLEERKYINGVISRGLFGAALSLTTAWGLANGQIKYGGTWDDRNKRKVIGSDGTVLSPGEWEFFGWRAPKLMDAFINHVPEMLPIALTTNVFQIHELDDEGGSFGSYGKTIASEIQERFPFITLVGLFNRPAETLEDRFTRVPIAQDVEKQFDDTPRSHKTFGEKLKSNMGLDFLNPEKYGATHIMNNGEKINLSTDQAVELNKISEGLKKDYHEKLIKTDEYKNASAGEKKKLEQRFNKDATDEAEKQMKEKYPDQFPKPSKGENRTKQRESKRLKKEVTSERFSILNEIDA